MPPTLTLPRADGTLEAYTLSGRAPVTAPAGPITSRVGMAAVERPRQGAALQPVEASVADES